MNIISPVWILHHNMMFGRNHTACKLGSLIENRAANVEPHSTTIAWTGICATEGCTISKSPNCRYYNTSQDEVNHRFAMIAFLYVSKCLSASPVPFATQ